jgi:putative ATP-binding cassette transporter
MYIVVGTLIFIVPMLVDEFSSSVVAASTAGIFLVGQLSGLIQTIPALSEANASAKSLMTLQEELAKTSQASLDNTQQLDIAKFESLTLENILYKHSMSGASNAGNEFVLGPVSYDFKAGNIYFIKGNNGSGKTTFMRILTGLYSPTQGDIRVNHILVEQPASRSYRDLFSVVFTDFYLFKKMYGLFDVDEIEIDTWQKVLEIANKFKVKGGDFSNIALSTGQRKRIALFVALLENKDIIVLDEWAADQDPEFRHKFYKLILPMLKAMGKTVIAITHDDQYFDQADFRLSFQGGKLLEEEE